MPLVQSSKQDALGSSIIAGEGVAGTQTGGVLTVQGDPSGTSVPVSRPISYTTGNITAVNTGVTLTLLEGQSAWDVYISGTFSAGTTLAFQGSIDNTNWFYLDGRINSTATTNETTTVLASSFAGGANPLGNNPSNWRGNVSGIRFFRVFCLTYTTSDNIAVQISTSSSTGAVFLNAPPPTPADKTGVGSIAALNGTVVASTVGCSNVTFNIMGTWVGSIGIQATTDTTNWFYVLGQIPASGFANTVTANTPITVPCGSYAQVRLLGAAWTSGTANITYDAGLGTNILFAKLESEGVDNTTAPVATMQVGGMDPTGKIQAFITVPSGEQFVRDVLNVSGQNRAQSVTTTAAEALGGSTILVNRKSLTIRPTNGIIYWGFTTGVTTTTGTPIYTNEVFTISATDNLHIYVISAGTVDARISEAS